MLCGGELELRKNVRRRLKGGVSVRLYCITNNYKIYSRKRFLLSTYRPTAALLEAVDLWDDWAGSVPYVLF